MSLLPKSILSLFFITTFSSAIYSQTANPKIKCYFNKTVNTALSTGVNAMYNTAFKDTLIGHINRSKYTLDFCIYNYTYSSGDGFDAIATAVNNAYNRGVVVRWIYDGASINSGLSLLNTGINKLGSPTTSSYGISHNKFVIIDANSSNSNDSYVWTGSFNFSLNQNTTDYNNVIIFQDKPLAQAFTSQFNQMWGATTAAPNLTNSKFGTFKTVSAQTNFTVNGTPVQVYFSPKDNATGQMQNVINTANTDLFFGIYTFTDNNIATGIKNRVLAGVVSKGIEDSYSQSYAPNTTLSGAMGANFKVYSGSGIYHNKFLIVDPSNPSSDPLVATGSYNWSSSGTSLNDENMVVVHDAVVTNQYYQSFCKNFTDIGGTACIPVSGINDFDFGSQTYAVYPNPANTKINIQLKNYSKNLKVIISDNLGKIVLNEQTLNTDLMTIAISNLVSGVYIVTVYADSEKFVQKLVKD